jgi:predicted nucleic acid-binding protein
MTISPELAMLDTNVLIYAYYEDAPQYPAAFPLLDRAQEAGTSLCLSPQVLAEYYAVITDPRRVSAPFTIDEALAEIGRLRALPGLTLLPVPLDVVDRWVALLREYPVTGR